MLSKVAERLYWTARYLERAENVARLVSVYDSLLFDLPKDIDISWYNLVTLNSAEELFEERYKNRDERNVVKFTLADDTNGSSMLTSLKLIRENVRTTRDVLPQDCWEVVNELYLYASENIQQGINRSARHEYLTNIIKGCQQVNGLFMGTMSRDAAWQFLGLGKNIERSDMVTRLVDAGAVAHLEVEDDTEVELSQLIWGNVLRSSSAELSYRRTLRSKVRDFEVVNFLLTDPAFPRSLYFALSHMTDLTDKLPNAEAVTKSLKKILKSSYALEDSSAISEELREHINSVQVGLITLHERIAESWFSLDTQRGTS